MGMIKVSSCFHFMLEKAFGVREWIEITTGLSWRAFRGIDVYVRLLYMGALYLRFSKVVWFSELLQFFFWGDPDVCLLYVYDIHVHDF